MWLGHNGPICVYFGFALKSLICFRLRCRCPLLVLFHIGFYKSFFSFEYNLSRIRITIFKINIRYTRIQLGITYLKHLNPPRNISYMYLSISIEYTFPMRPPKSPYLIFSKLLTTIDTTPCPPLEQCTTCVSIATGILNERNIVDSSFAPHKTPHIYVLSSPFFFIYTWIRIAPLAAIAVLGCTSV